MSQTNTRMGSTGFLLHKYQQRHNCINAERDYETVSQAKSPDKTTEIGWEWNCLPFTLKRQRFTGYLNCSYMRELLLGAQTWMREPCSNNEGDNDIKIKKNYEKKGIVHKTLWLEEVCALLRSTVIYDDSARFVSPIVQGEWKAGVWLQPCPYIGLMAIQAFS